MKLVFAAAARRDLLDIGDYIERDSRGQALRFVTRLERLCGPLVAQPERYPLLPRYATRGIRRAPHGDYLVFYRIGEERLEILRILHAARDVDALIGIL